MEEATFYDVVFIIEGHYYYCENDDNEPVPCSGGNDKLYGNAGDDLLYGGVANDLGDGGPNLDTCVLVEHALNCEA